MNLNPRWIHKFELKPNSWVFVPSEISIQEGREIKAKVEKIWQPSGAYFHLKAGGHVAALRCHMKNTSFLRLDIEIFSALLTKVVLHERSNLIWVMKLQEKLL